MYWSGREISRRISRDSRGSAVATSDQSLYRGPLEPLPQDRRSKTASATASSAVMACHRGGDGEVAGHDGHRGGSGLSCTLSAACCCGRTLRRAAAHRSGSPAATSRSSCLIASCGLVANSRSSGIPASRRRGMSLAQRPGMYTSKSARPARRGDVGGEHGGHAVLHRFVTPACCGATHAVKSPAFRSAVSSIAIPGPIRSAHRPAATPPPARAARPAGPSSPTVAAEQPLHPVPALMPGRLGEPQQFARVPGDSATA